MLIAMLGSAVVHVVDQITTLVLLAERFGIEPDVGAPRPDTLFTTRRIKFFGVNIFVPNELRYTALSGKSKL